MARKNISPKFSIKTRKTESMPLLIVLCLITGILTSFGTEAAPVIIDGDSEGSWSDSFEDNDGIVDNENISIDNGYASLGATVIFDPQNWTKQGLAVDLGSGGDYDSVGLWHSFVFKDGGIYKMWYAGWNGSNSRILYATSIDGIAWTKESMVLDIGSPGALDDSRVAIPQVIKDDLEYKMWYTGDDGSTERILYANSSDGVNWNKQGLVLDIGTPGQLDDTGVRTYHVLKEFGEYKMWYGGFDGSTYRMFYANSSNGISWNRQGLAVNVGGPGALDDTHVGGGSIVNDNGLYRMWYSGHDGSRYRILYAYSNDGINWNKLGLAMDIGSPGEYDDNQVSYPKVIKDEDGYFKMWNHGNDGSTTRIMYATSSYPYDAGYITSIKISLPAGQTWNSLMINKDESEISDYINITILDGETNTTISGFVNLTGSSIDLSTLDYLAHPTIKLHASFTGNGSTTPMLFDWHVTWHDTIPPNIPTGLTINNPFTGYSLILSWDSNSEFDLRSYVIYYSNNNVTFNWLGNISAGTITFTDYGLTQGATYYYKIAAADEVPNQSPFSYVVEGVPDTDYDGDSIGDLDDPDDDNDGIPDISDPYPLNPLNDIESTIDYMNTTIEDIQTRVIIIQTILENLNLTELLNAINYLNQTLPPKIDDISNQLTGVNDSLLGRVTDSETNILNELANVDASLSNEIQNALVSITNDIIDMNSSLSDELTVLLNTMITEHDGLQQWLELVIGLIDTNLTTTNNTLHSQLDYLDQSITNFYNNLEDDIGDVLSDLQLHDQNTGQNHSDIIGLLLDLLDGQIEKEQIEDLKMRLINLANDLTGHNQTITDDIMDVVGDIDAFENNINQQLININNTLDQLAKLEEILGDLTALDQSLEQVEENIQDSVDDRSTRDEDEERFFMIELFLIILFILLIIDLIATIMMGKRRKGEGPTSEPKPAFEGKSQELTIQPRQIEQEQPDVPESSASDGKLPPPRPPLTNQ